jgi:hypothetical protein
MDYFGIIYGLFLFFCIVFIIELGRRGKLLKLEILKALGKRSK